MCIAIEQGHVGFDLCKQRFEVIGIPFFLASATKEQHLFGAIDDGPKQCGICLSTYKYGDHKSFPAIMEKYVLEFEW